VFFGPWQSVYSCFRSWTRSGLWRAIHEALTEQADREHVLIDSTAVRVHAHGSGPAGGSLAQAMGRSRASVLGQDPHGLWAPWVIRWDLS
jgi:transposase